MLMVRFITTRPSKEERTSTVSEHSVEHFLLGGHFPDYTDHCNTDFKKIQTPLPESDKDMRAGRIHSTCPSSQVSGN